MAKRRIVMIGSTGLIGRQFAARTAGEAELHCLQRSGGGPGTVHVADPEEWPTLSTSLAPDIAVSALGTTMRKAGSEAAFRAVDLDMVAAFAEAARKGGARQMIAVSSIGADAASRNFYLRTKGEMEARLGALGFERLDIFRPGLLRGPRGGDRRAGERIGIALSPLVNLVLRGPLDRYAAIDALDVAAAMAAIADASEPGTFVHHNRDIRRSAHD
ncbi:hypothetical protein [Allosphingosinicella indica]|uniref:Uncharacterized conserved protein YbjT, contains NAD(P)-binding and DUF2867 domains n=1 Tax=Allosphingosinicella indica TaxID=941907 RepID=A0A1X7G061_9SPHN|nr:hypothetical protein [Allosphingosinicella indica]SMF61656.1 Uncharacterized conserved protein YbjT, contains NAD(P)-binding and DUF2867 domains [Allosphingosinicella indica]